MAAVQYSGNVSCVFGVPEFMQKCPERSIENSIDSRTLINADTLIIGTYCFNLPIISSPPSRSGGLAAMSSEVKKYSVVLGDGVIENQMIPKAV
jgi:hypothetical protein